MNDAQIREFLVRWVMEMGSSTFDWFDMKHSAWYHDSPISIRNHTELHKFFVLQGKNGSPDLDRGLQRITINQAGLDFIKE
jgi:hypothetical protein